jgi:hypothetical protein
MLGGPPPPDGGAGAGGYVRITGTGNVLGTGTGTGAVTGTGTGGSTTTIPNCGAVNRSVRRLTPEVLLVLDRSASMNLNAAGDDCGGDCGPSSRWAQLTSAIDQVVAMTSTKVNWGLKAFADSDGACGVGSGVAVPVGPSNAGVVAATIAGWTGASGSLQTSSQSPTRAAEDAAAAYLSALGSPDPKLILLATAGAPDCRLATTPTTLDDATGAAAAVQAARNLGIPTFVLGAAGASTADATLSALANAGGVPRSGTKPYYSVASADELASLVDAIFAVASSCTFALGPLTNSMYSNDYIDLFADGVKIPQDASHSDGWDYTDALRNVIKIYGATCDALTAGTVTNITVTYRCPLG